MGCRWNASSMQSLKQGNVSSLNCNKNTSIMIWSHNRSSSLPLMSHIWYGNWLRRLPRQSLSPFFYYLYFCRSRFHRLSQSIFKLRKYSIIWFAIKSITISRWTFPLYWNNFQLPDCLLACLLRSPRSFRVVRWRMRMPFNWFDAKWLIVIFNAYSSLSPHFGFQFTLTQNGFLSWSTQ
jgi:hypothetical protein